MVKLREYQAKEIFRRYGLMVPRGAIARSPEEAKSIVSSMDCAVVMKPQLGVKKRGKAGAIAFVNGPEEAFREAVRLFNMQVYGEEVTVLLAEEKLAIKKELYVAITIDYAARTPVLMISDAGGMDVEEILATFPERLLKIPVSIIAGINHEITERITTKFDVSLSEVISRLYRVFRDYDAELLEINPLILTTNNEYWAADAVLNINEDSLFRHEDLLEMKKDIPVEDPLAEEANQKSWTYIRLDGNIGILSSGAGLTMAILDLLHNAGGKAANFLDTAQIDDAGIFDAFELLSRASGYSVLMVNIFAGLNRCDLLAEGIVRYLQKHPMDVPVVVRMIGNHEAEGHKILKAANIEPFSYLEDAIERVVALAEVSP